MTPARRYGYRIAMVPIISLIDYAGAPAWTIYLVVITILYAVEESEKKKEAKVRAP